MSVAQSEARYTVEEYLASERESEERHEYLDGQIYLMAGESPEHADICTNQVLQLAAQLKNTPSRVRWLFSYPDSVVICGEPHYYDEHRDSRDQPQRDHRGAIRFDRSV